MPFLGYNVLEDVFHVAHSARGSHACKSPLDDTTYEAFPVICTPALALTAMRSLTPASPRSQLHPCHCTVFPCAGPNPAMTSFTPVHHEADWVLPGPTRAWQRPFFTLR